MNTRLLRQAAASSYLGIGETKFNKLVRPFIPEIRQGRMVLFDRLDLDSWADDFKQKKGIRLGNATWQNTPPALEKKAKSGTSPKSSAATSFTKALEKRNSNAPKAT